MPPLREFTTYNPTDDELQALAHFRERLTTMNNARVPFIERFKRNESLYRSQLDVARRADWQSQLFIPRTYGLIQAELAQLALNKPDIVLDPENKGDAMRIPYVKAVALENWKKNNGASEFLFGFLDSLKMGSGFFEIGYRNYQRDVKEIIDFDPGTGQIEWKPKKITEFDDVFFEAFRPEDLFIDESVAWIKDAKDGARRYTFSYEAFIDQFADKYPKAYSVRPGSQSEIIDEDNTKWSPFTIEDLSWDVLEDVVEVYKFYDKIEDTMWILANGILLNNPDDPIPFHHKQIPFAEIKPAPWDKYTFYGAGIPELVEDLQDEMNTIRNMMVDQAHLNVFTPFLFSGDEDLSEDIMRIEPGIGIPVEDPSNFQFIKQGNIGPDGYRQAELIDEDMRQATGIDPRFQGLAAGGTATETAFLKETTLQRINLHLQFLERASMPRFAEIWGDTLQQFYFKSTKTQKKLGGKEGEDIFRTVRVDQADLGSFQAGDLDEKGGFLFLTVTPEQIRGTYDWNLKIGTSVGISKELSKQLALRFYATLSQDPLADRERLLRDVIETHEKDPAQYMVTMEQVDKTASVWLAEEQNKMILAGQAPEVVTALITPEHISVHQALVSSDADVSPAIRRLVMQHVVEEIKALRAQRINSAVAKAEASKQLASAMQGGGQEQESAAAQVQGPGVDRISSLTKRLTSTPGLPRAATTPGDAATLSADRP